MTALHITLDASPAITAINDLSAALSKFSELPIEIVDRLIELTEGGIELSSAGLDGGTATDTFELSLVAQPSDSLRRLVSALRAGNVDLSVVENALSHNNSPSVGALTVPTADESPVTRKGAGGSTNSNSGDIEE